MRPSVHLRAFGGTSIGVAGGNDSWSDENGSAGCDATRAFAPALSFGNCSSPRSVAELDERGAAEIPDGELKIVGFASSIVVPSRTKRTSHHVAPAGFLRCRHTQQERFALRTTWLCGSVVCSCGRRIVR